MIFSVSLEATSKLLWSPLVLKPAQKWTVKGDPTEDGGDGVRVRSHSWSGSAATAFFFFFCLGPMNLCFRNVCLSSSKECLSGALVGL